LLVGGDAGPQRESRMARAAMTMDAGGQVRRGRADTAARPAVRVRPAAPAEATPAPPVVQPYPVAAAGAARRSALASVRPAPDTRSGPAAPARHGH
ncbi:hypothetical protein AB3M83_00005, partial [Microbacterium sp. 179-B 1A2 NHS]